MFNLQKKNFTELHLRDDKSQFKIIWINEMGGRNAGISIGFFGELGGLHSTYHADGVYHYRPKDAVSFPDIQKTPISKIDPFIQVHFQAIPLNESNISLVTSEESERVPNKVIVLESKDFYHKNQVSIDVYLVKKGAENRLLSSIDPQVRGEGALWELVGVEFIDLKNFPEHRVELVLLSEKIKSPKK